jgi:hypothetical protein
LTAIPAVAVTMAPLVPTMASLMTPSNVCPSFAVPGSMVWRETNLQQTGSPGTLLATTGDEVARSDTPISTRAHIRRNRPKVAHTTCGLYDARAYVKPRIRTYETTRSAKVVSTG